MNTEISKYSIGSAKNIDAFKTNLFSINELSSGLVVAMPNIDILKGYNTAVLSQNKALLNISTPTTEIFNKSYLDSQKNIMGNYAPFSTAIAGIGLANANAIKLFDSGSISQSQVLFTQQVSGFCLSGIEQQQSILASSLHIKIEPPMTSMIMTEPTWASTQMVGNGLNTMIKSLPTYPELNLISLKNVEKVIEIKEEKISEHQKDLDRMLKKIDPELAVYRNGCWDTFHKKGNDYIGQSASSMRRLVDCLFRSLAPIEKVQETNFYKTSPKGKDKAGKPTRHARVCYILNYDKKKTEHIERLIKGFLGSWDNLSAWDHTPLNKDNFVQGAFITIEGYLLSILSETNI